MAMLHKICVLKIRKIERPSCKPDVEDTLQKFRALLLELGTCKIRPQCLDKLVLVSFFT
jgi:hypothetical protein